jgi:hypothetical protein
VWRDVLTVDQEPGAGTITGGSADSGTIVVALTDADPDYVGRGEVTSATTGTSVPVTLPANVVSGDILVATVATLAATTVTVAGWTVQDSAEDTGVACMYVLTKTAGGSETDPTFTLGTSTRHLAVIDAYRNRSGVYVTDGATAASSATPTVPAVTPVTDGAIIHTGAAVATNSGWLSDWDILDGRLGRETVNVLSSSLLSFGAAHVPQAAAGATAPSTVTNQTASVSAIVTIGLEKSPVIPPSSGGNRMGGTGAIRKPPRR